MRSALTDFFFSELVNPVFTDDGKSEIERCGEIH